MDTTVRTKVWQMYKQGAPVKEIAKDLKVRVGEVKAVIKTKTEEPWERELIFEEKRETPEEKERQRRKREDLEREIEDKMHFYNRRQQRL